MSITVEFHKPVKNRWSCPQCGHAHKAVQLLHNDSPPPYLLGYAVVCDGCDWHADPGELPRNAIGNWNRQAKLAKQQQRGTEQ